MGWSRLGILTVALLGGCAARRFAVERADVSAELEARVGSGLSEARAEGTWPDGVDLSDGLDIDEAVATALWNNAELEVALTALGFARADLVGAGKLANPTLTGVVPLGPRQWQAAIALPLEALWIRPARVQEARARSEAAGQRVVQLALDLVRDTRVAWVRAAAAEDRAVLLARASALQEEAARLATARVGTGDTSPLDADMAALARHAAALAEGDADGARDQGRAELAWRLGVPVDGTLAPLATTLPPVRALDPEALVAVAMAARPDARALELDLEAATHALDVARRAAVAATVGVHVQYGPTSNSRGPGLTGALTLPIVDWNQDGIARARAAQDEARARRDALAERIRFDLRVAVADLEAARDARDATGAGLVPSAEAAARRVEAGWRVGDVARDATVAAELALVDARLADLDAAVRLAEAWAQVQRHLGASPDGPARAAAQTLHDPER